MRHPADYLTRAVKITVCADGCISIMITPKDRRLKAALPCYSVDTVEHALYLIQRVAAFKAVGHGGKVGTTVEAWVPGWPEDADISDIKKLGQAFARMDAESAQYGGANV